MTIARRGGATTAAACVIALLSGCGSSASVRTQSRGSAPTTTAVPYPTAGASFPAADLSTGGITLHAPPPGSPNITAARATQTALAGFPGATLVAEELASMTDSHHVPLLTATVWAVRLDDPSYQASDGPDPGSGPHAGHSTTTAIYVFVDASNGHILESYALGSTA